MDTTAVSIFNNLMGQYNGGINAIQQGSIEIGKELFFAIALISVAVLGINRLFNKEVDAVEANIELIRLIIYLNVFYLFITKFDQFLPMIVSSFKQAGIYMGSKVSHYAVITNPGDIINNGVSIASKILNIAKKEVMFLNFGMALIAVGAAAVILFCFGRIAIELVLIDIGSHIILAAGIFLLAFAGSQWTRDYATRYVNTFFNIGIKILFVYLLVGIGGGLTDTWSATLDNVPKDKILESYIAIIMATFVFYMLCLRLPDMAASYLAGGSSIGFSQGDANVRSVIQGAAVVGAGIVASQKGIVGAALNLAGIGKAVGQAKSAASEGSNSNFGNVALGSIKTLGDATGQTIKDKWDSKVHQTAGGQVAQKIKSNQLTKDKGTNNK